jgi:hypothetical protein
MRSTRFTARALRMTAVALLVIVFAVAALAGPTDGPPPRPRVSADVVAAAVTPTKLAAAAGGEVTFAVQIEIAPTWHLYDHSYVHDPESFYIGVDLMPGEGADLAGYQATFPVGKQGEFMGEPVVMLYGKAAIEVTARLPASAAGEVTIPLVLTVQACDDKICLQPSDIPLTATVAVQ